MLVSLIPVGREADLAAWPTDLFGACWALLHGSGGVDGTRLDVPRAKTAASTDHRRRPDVADVAAEWRRAIRRRRGPPKSVLRAWEEGVLSCRNLPLARLGRNSSPDTFHAVIWLLAVADETCRGVGFPRPPRADRSGLGRALKDRGLRRRLLERVLHDTDGRSLCRSIDPSRLVVLPKSHTPDKGATLRSLSHYVAAWLPVGVESRWRFLPAPLVTGGPTGDASVNVLFLPWPLRTRPTELVPADPGELRTLHDRRSKDEDFAPVASFTYRPAERVLLKDVRAAIDQARLVVGEVHVVLFPELALRDGDVRRFASELGCAVIAGTGRPATAGRPGLNLAEIAVPQAALGEKGPHLTVAWSQRKHHPWRIDPAQVRQYGLGSSLSPNCGWLESIEGGTRAVEFLVLREGLSLCLLVCEDLARQDPVAPIVRAVGPDLVIGLLMDGPQLDSRWPARYAAVLADDPGSSVLTVTSLGMASLSRPPGKDASRAVALWRDPMSAAQVLNLPPDAVGLALTLSRTPKTEWSADGRSDRGSSSVVTLTGVHPVPATADPSGGRRLGRRGV